MEAHMVPLIVFIILVYIALYGFDERGIARTLLLALALISLSLMATIFWLVG
jgi:hypothetical protein